MNHDSECGRIARWGGGIRNGTDSHFPLCRVLHETSEIKGGPVINNIQKAVLDPGLVEDIPYF